MLVSEHMTEVFAAAKAVSLELLCNIDLVKPRCVPTLAVTSEVTCASRPDDSLQFRTTAMPYATIRPEHINCTQFSCTSLAHVACRTP